MCPSLPRGRGAGGGGSRRCRRVATLSAQHRGVAGGCLPAVRRLPRAGREAAAQPGAQPAPGAAGLFRGSAQPGQAMSLCWHSPSSHGQVAGAAGLARVSKLRGQLGRDAVPLTRDAAPPCRDLCVAEFPEVCAAPGYRLLSRQCPHPGQPFGGGRGRSRGWGAVGGWLRAARPVPPGTRAGELRWQRIMHLETALLVLH